MMSFNAALTWALLMLAVGVIAGIRGTRRANYDQGYADGHTQGVLDATPWRCSCGHHNRPNNLMCAHCGIDRFPSRFVHSENS